MLNDQEWFKYYAQHFGPLPDSYLVIDTETTGVNANTDLILELATVLVKDKKVVEEKSVILNWIKNKSINQSWFKQRLAETKHALKKKGFNYPWTPELISTGVDPLEALAEFLVVLLEPPITPLFIVGHNIFNFDLRIISNHFSRFLFYEYLFECDNIVDTGIIEKSSQLAIPMTHEEDMCDFSQRVLKTPFTVKWSLDKHVIPKYNLHDRFNLDPTCAHRALFDCNVVYRLLETYKEYYF